MRTSRRPASLSDRPGFGIYDAAGESGDVQTAELLDDWSTDWLNRHTAKTFRLAVLTAFPTTAITLLIAMLMGVDIGSLAVLASAMGTLLAIALKALR